MQISSNYSQNTQINNKPVSFKKWYTSLYKNANFNKLVAHFDEIKKVGVEKCEIQDQQFYNAFKRIEESNDVFEIEHANLKFPTEDGFMTSAQLHLIKNSETVWAVGIPKDPKLTVFDHLKLLIRSYLW